PPVRSPKHWGLSTRAGRRRAKEKEAKTVRRLSGRERLEPARPHSPRLSRLSQMPAPRQMPLRRGRGAPHQRALLETKWRQIPPHTGQLRARTLLLLSACPTSNSKTQQLPWLAWTEFLNPTSMANSRWGQQPVLALPNARPPCRASGHRICARPRAATRPPRRRAWPRIFVVGCRLPCDPPVGGHAHATEGTLARFDGAVCGHFAPQVRSAAFLRLAWRTSASAPSSERTMAQFLDFSVMRTRADCIEP